MLEGGATAVQADDDVVGAARVRELENVNRRAKLALTWSGPLGPDRMVFRN